MTENGFKKVIEPIINSMDAIEDVFNASSKTLTELEKIQSITSVLIENLNEGVPAKRLVLIRVMKDINLSLKEGTYSQDAIDSVAQKLLDSSVIKVYSDIIISLNNAVNGYVEMLRSNNTVFSLTLINLNKAKQLLSPLMED